MAIFRPHTLEASIHADSRENVARAAYLRTFWRQGALLTRQTSEINARV